MPEFLHNRAEHILAKNPSMPKSMAFAIATQQGHALKKNPKGYGTAKGRREAKQKYKTPKDDIKMANPGDLESSKLSSAFALELSEILKQAGIGSALKNIAMMKLPRTDDWVIGNAQRATMYSKATPGLKKAVGSRPRAASGTYDVSRLANQMGV